MKRILPVPDLLRDSIYDIKPEDLLRRGVRFVLLDIDNTIAPYTVHEATAEMRAWVAGLQGAGLDLYILSNNRGDRPERFAAAFGLPYRKRARKPFQRTLRSVLTETGYKAEESCLIGDQIYTDTACAKWCGALAVTVKPIRFTNPWLLLRYWLEAPFRLLGRGEEKKAAKYR